jgi:peptidyl-prolyl cis-trans isomerase D
MILDLMRREKKKFLGILLVPLMFGLVAYLIPGMPGGAWGGGLGASVLATVGVREISSKEFIGSYQRFLRSGQFPYDRQFLKTLQIDRQILNQLVSREVMLNEAKRLGIDATANELQQKIFALPYFQDNGNFAFNRYKAILEAEWHDGPAVRGRGSRGNYPGETSEPHHRFRDSERQGNRAGISRQE